VERSRDYFKKIVETVVNQPLLVLDDELRVRTANQTFCDTFKLSRERTEGASVFDLDNGRWDLPELRTILAQAATGEAAQQGTPIEQGIPSVGNRRVMVNARSFELDDARRWILVAMEVVDAQEAR
jgi:PAS domain-containing protein